VGTLQANESWQSSFVLIVCDDYTTCRPLPSPPKAVAAIRPAFAGDSRVCALSSSRNC
jgi:hypothetical protein